MDDDLTADEGGSRDGIDDFLDENYKRTTERQADSNVINRVSYDLTSAQGMINKFFKYLFSKRNFLFQIFKPIFSSFSNLTFCPNRGIFPVIYIF